MSSNKRYSLSEAKKVTRDFMLLQAKNLEKELVQEKKKTTANHLAHA